MELACHILSPSPGYGKLFLAALFLCTWLPDKEYPQDYARALQFLNKVDWQNKEADYMRGVIYAQGLGGVAADIPKGVAYLQKAGSFTKAKEEELLHYKKTLFGKWVRRN